MSIKRIYDYSSSVLKDGIGFDWNQKQASAAQWASCDHLSSHSNFSITLLMLLLIINTITTISIIVLPYQHTHAHTQTRALQKALGRRPVSLAIKGSETTEVLNYYDSLTIAFYRAARNVCRTN
jgi:hypothetical protein